MVTNRKKKVRKFLVCLESRASYSYALPLMKLLKKNKKKAIFSTVVTGMHLEKEFGSTFNFIKKDNINIDYLLKFYKKDWAYSIGKQIIKYSKILLDFKPDIVLIFGDRVELVPIAISSSYKDIPVAHIQAGDKSGHIDDMTRMMLSKICHIHLASSKQSQRRLIKLGEQKFRIFNVGAPQLDDIHYTKLIKTKRIILNDKIFELKKEKYLILIQHPVFSDRKNYYKKFIKTLKACQSFDLKLIIIYPNYDPGYEKIIQIIKNSKNKDEIIVLKNLERQTFLKLMVNTQCLVGNSSCGILEAPTLKVGVVNVGDRQEGRERNVNILDAGYSTIDIKKKIKKILTNKKFLLKIENTKNFYGDGKSTRRIFDKILAIKLGKKLNHKKTTY